MEQVKESNGKMMLVIGQWLLVICKWVGCLLLIGFISSCSVSKQISKQADTILLKDTAIRTGHIGISIYEPATNTYWYNYNADKYFMPASNTKLFTLYAGMRYLGDSLVGLRYQSKIGAINIFPTGDPSFLHSDFKNQPVLDFLQSVKKNKNFCFSYNYQLNTNPKLQPLGNGWAWNDYNEGYMVERNHFPIYGNIIKFAFDSLIYSKNQLRIKWKTVPKYFASFVDTINTIQLFDRNVDSSTLSKKLLQFDVQRDLGSNKVRLKSNNNNFLNQAIPFYTDENNVALDILKSEFEIEIANCRIQSRTSTFLTEIYPIHSQPSDSLFKPMMHRSDNFFAEQTLLMASNEYLGYMSDEKIIDTILKTTLKDIPQKPKWVDGSGLSRYNLFTPRSFVYILNKTKNEFGWERVKNILPTGGRGTLSSYFKNDSGFIYAKTGTLSNNCALSGYLITKKGKLLIFSVLNNNYGTGATPVRKAVEKFLQNIREKY